MKIKKLRWLEPIVAFKEQYARPFPAILESAISSSPYGHYSFVCSDPFLVLESRNNQIKIFEKNSCQIVEENPFDILKQLVKENYRQSGLDIPFSCGAIGYFGYDLRYFIEELPDTSIADLNFPDMYFAFYDQALCFDHIQKSVHQIELENHGRPRAVKSTPQDAITPIDRDAKLSSNFSKVEYLNAVKKAKTYIKNGDIYQVNLSQRFHTTSRVTSHLSIYERLREISPSVYTAMLKFGSKSVISSSPEEFLFVKDKYIRTRPIKGTRRRGQTLEEDAKLKQELLESKKDDAELAMIIDLERNDLGKVCEYSSVRVSEPKVLESHPAVFHLSATVEGTLLDGVDPIDIINATFPGGSVTGAPKVRAMQIIEELEPTKRSVYTGAIGYIGFNGTMHLSMAIRVILADAQNLYFQVGGAIVDDSEPELEYQETLDKASAILQTLMPSQ